MNHTPAPLDPMLWGISADFKQSFVPLRSDYEWYLEIDMDSEFPGQSLVSCTPKALVFIEKNLEGKIRLEPIHSELALERLGLDIYPCEETVRMRHFQTLRSLIQVQAFVLSHGGHPSAAVDTIAALCKGRS